MRLINQQRNKFNILPLFAVATLGLNLVTLAILMFHNSILQTLGGKLPQSLAQLVDGRAITLDSQENLERHPETIRRFVGESLTLMFTWSNKQPPNIVWSASSLLLSDNLRRRFESEFLQGIPVNNAATPPADLESLFVIKTISQPKQIGNGRWQIDILANRITFTRYDKSGLAIPFRKKIVVQALDTQAISQPDASIPIHSAIYRLGEARLEIANICNIQDQTCP